MILAIGLLMAWAVLAIAPETSIGRGLHRLIVAAPARLLNRVRRGHVLLALLAGMVVTCAVLTFEGDGVRLLSMAAPDVIAWAVMVDLATVLEVAFAAVLVAGRVRWRALLAWLPRPARARRRRRAATRPPRRTAANDDDDGRAGRIAA